MAPNYEYLCNRALLTFRHQRVWNPIAKQLTHLTPLSAQAQDRQMYPNLDFLGADIPQEIASWYCAWGY